MEWGRIGIMLDYYVANINDMASCKVKSHTESFTQNTATGTGLLFTVVLLVTTLLVSHPSLASDTTPSSKAHKSGYDNEEGFAGPGSAVYELEKDDEEKNALIGIKAIDDLMQPWFNFKKDLNEKHGFQLGLAYTTTYQTTDDEVAGMDDTAWSGVLRVTGKWELFNRGQANKGSLVFSVDNRANYRDTSPADFGGNVGFIAQPGYLFSDPDTVLVDLHWQQYLNDGKTGVVIGRYDPTDFMHVLGHKSPWTAFQNLNISLDSSIAYPDSGVGIGIGHWFDQTEVGQFYVLGGFNDANGKVTDEKMFEQGAEFFKYAEVGWSPTRDQRYTTNVHLTLWDVDERKHDAVDSAYGFAIGANYTLERVTYFAQYGRSDVDDPADPQIYERSINLGATMDMANSSNQAGLALNYGDMAAPGLDDQTVIEAYYRVQVTKNLALTPSVQHIKDPALNPSDDVTIFAMRVRLTL